MRHYYFNLNQIKSNPDGQPTVNRQSRLMSYRGYLKNLAMIFAVLVMSIANIDMAWASVAVTWTASQTDFNNTFNSSTADTRLAGLAVGSGTRTFTVYTTSALANSNATPSLTWNKTNYFVAGDNNYKKAGIAIKLPSDCDDVDSIYFYVKTTNSRKIYYEANVSSVSSSNPSNTLTITTSFAGYKMGSTYIKGRYFAVGGRSGGSGDNAIQKVIVYFHEAPTCGETAQAALTLSSNSGTICGTGSTTFTVSGGSGTGALSVSSSDESKATASIEGSTVTVTGVAAGSATITVTKACDATYAEATADYSVTVNSVPTANAGVDKTTEPKTGVALAATAAADGCTGAWTIVSGPNTATSQLSSTSSAKATFTPTVAGTYTLRWTVTNTSSSCSAYDEMKVTAATCAISSCGNATITYAINGGSSGDHSEGGADLISSATASNTTALGASTTVGYTGISMSSLAKKAAAATSACYPTKPNMSGKIGVYNGAAYNSSNYLQFAFTVKTGYTFTPCDIEFTVQPVDVATNFRWEVTDGTNVYGYGTATDVPKGSDGGASVLTGLTSTAEMAAGTYYIRLYPYVNAASKTFRISNDVILKGTTASAAPSCTAPTNVAISGEYVHFPGETLTLTVSGDNIAQDATYTWKKGDQVIAGQTTATLTINSCEITDAGNYTCTISNGGSCEATANYTVKMYSLRGLTDNNWTTDFVFTKVNATTATYSMELTGSSSYDFKVYDGSAYYGNTGGNPTMTSDNCTNWTMQENMGNNVTLQTTAAGTYTFTLNYTNASNPTISVTYPAKRIVYLNPGVWYTGENQEKFVVHAWYSSTVQDILMTKIDDCADRNIYQAEIDANHEQVIFIRVNPAGLNLSNPWSNEWNRTKDLTLISENQFTINNWGGTGEWNDGTEKSSGAWENFTPNYTVTFDANNHGTAPDAQCVAKNGRATTPAAPTATGYTFGGWYKEAGCINAYDFNTEVTSNITLYAKWTAETYNIKYFEAIGDDATGQDLRELTIGGAIATYTIEDAITLPELPAKDGYTATGWYTKWCVFPDDGGNGNGWEGCTPIMIQPVGYYGHTNFIVKYTPNSYTITWDVNGGNELTGEYTSGTVVYGTTITKPADPTREGYTFAGWSPAVAATMPANDVTYTAQWTCTTPTISTQPINATYTQNTAAAALSVTATANDGTLSYQWQSSTDNSNFTNISGATGNEYTPSTTEVGTTYYRCVVTNTTGSCIVTSASATITVTAASVEPDPEPELVPQVGTFTGAGTSGMVNLYWTMPTKPVTTTVDIASATLSAAVGQSAGATSTITKVNTNEIKVEYSTTEGWQAAGVKIPLATPKTNVESITFEYKSYPSQNVDFIPFLYDGTRWVESDFTKLTPTEWTSHTSVITQEAWNNSNIYSTNKTIESVNFYANPGTATSGTFYIRNVVLNQGTQVAASGLIIVRKEGSNPTSPTDTDGTIVYNGDGIAATCTDDGLENGTTYHYAAYAHDGQDNYSEPLYWQYTYREELNTYAPDDTDFPNPERGFYEQVQWNANKGYGYNAVIGDSYFADARAANRSLILRIYYMDSDELRQNEELPPAFITMFNEDMAKFRTNGMKCILRFAYDENSGDGYQDASPATWATHLAQLKTHLEANADVIYVVQAGFLGVWGEWYYSSQGTGNAILPNTKNNLIDQLLDAVPANRCVQLRTPLFKKEYLASTDALTPETAYKGTAQARLGHHNDAFLNGERNQGTYENRATDMEYIAQECLYVPIGGETNLEESQVDDLYEAYCKGTVAEAEMAQLHYSYLNYSYSTVVTNRWKAEGSYARMSKYMGYRFELASASLPNKATAGTQMNVQLNIKNVGYAPLYNERHAYIVFKNNTNTYSIQLSSDPRTWAPNSAVTPINENIALPADMVAGTYDMYLHLPDASANIANNPKYAVRFANQGIWEPETGYNKLNKQITITAACTEPTITFANGTYTVGGSVLDLSTLFDSNSNGAVTYTVTNVNGTGASINGTSFTATSIGTATVKATQAANGDYCSGEATATITVNATQDPEPEDLYTVTYDAQDGSVTPTSETVSTATLPTPTKSGYTFQGWYTSGGTLISGTYNPTADITLHALWRSSECAGGGGGGSTTLISYTITAECKGDDPCELTASGTPGGTAYLYKLASSDGKYKLNNDYAYFALRLSSGYFQTGDVLTMDGSKAMEVYTGTHGSGTRLAATSEPSDGVISYTLPNTLPNNTNEIYVYRSSSTYNGKLTYMTVTRAGGGPATCYYVTYNGNGADGGFTTDEASHPSGSNVTVKTNGFTKTGYTFTGWNTMANGSGTSYAAGGTIEGISGNVTLYAQWVLDACSAPAAPTAFSAGSITSTGATFSITDEGDAASYDIYYSESSTAPTEVTAATTTSTSKTKAVTGLTASTTYYAWVRSVCDADHKSDWFALGTTSFTTSAAEPDPLVHWTMKINQSSWGTTATATTDETNITSINTSRSGTTTNTSTDATVKVTMASAEVSDNSAPDNSANFTFTVNSAKKVVPEKVTCQVFNVSSGNRTYKAQISDNNGHVYNSTNTLAVSTEAKLTDATFNFASGGVLVGDVTLKIYAWKTSGSPTEFRMGADVKLFGTVDNFVCTALNLTRGGQENGTYTVGNYTGNPLTCTVNAGEPASYQWKQYTQGQGVGEAVNAVGSGSTTPSFTPNPVSANTYFYACEVTDICGNTLITPYTGTFVFNTAATYSVTHTLTNVTATSGATGASAATEGVAYNAEFAANTGYVLPSTITVTIGGSPATVGTGYTWNASTGAFQVPAAQVTGAIEITIAGETAPATKDIYYGQVAIADGALVREITNGTVQFFTNIGGTVANTTEISLSSTPSTGGIYYNSNNLTDAALSESSNWGTSSGSNRYIRGLKFANGATYTLALGSKVASAITFYGWCGSSSKTMTVGEEEFTSSATKNTFAKHEFIKTGGFTGDVSITENGDFYGILVITIQTATPCTTPVIPALSNQTVCQGSDIAAWDATQTAVLADGETVAYSWKKKGNDTELANTASFDLGASAAESQAGTYVVTVTVSKAGYASATATKEVTLTVNEATEVTAITADKATVYPTNSVTLTATANMDATWQWYTCTNSAGDGEDDIDGATSASYTIASAPAAGTHYYKVKATGACGTAEKVYTLVVSASNSGETTCGEIKGQFTNGAYTFDTDFIIYGVNSDGNLDAGASSSQGAICGGSGNYFGKQRFVVTFPVDVLSFSFIGYQSNLRTVKAVKTTTDLKTADTEYTTITHTAEASQEGNCQTHVITPETAIPANTFVWVELSNGLNISEICYVPVSNVNCTDPQVIATVDNATVCEDTENVTFTATNYADGATLQWQKKNGNAWGNIGAPSATYTISPVTTEHAGQYRVIATTNECSRTSEELTLTVLTAPEFNAFANTASVMKGNALTINDVEATNATDYTWYKSADNSFDVEADTKVGTTKELLLAASSITEEADQTFYLFCVASNSCGSAPSNAITVTVTPFVEEDCATAGNEDEHEFGFDEDTECSLDTYGDSKTPVWKTSSRSRYLTYTAPEGKYFATAKVTVAHTGGTKCGYAYSTNRGATWEVTELEGLSTTLTAITIELPANVNAFRISRNLTAQDGEKDSASGNFYLAEACFTYENACTATTVTPSTASVDYEMGDDWTDPTFTLSVAGTLTYSSSNEDIASVDDDGTVTFNGEAGTVTITASYAGGTISETEYCASSGSYTINVSCPGGAPKIVADGSTDMVGCNTSVTLLAKTQAGGDFADGTYQWFRNGTEIDGATSSSYTATQAGTYTVERTNTSDCTTPSTNSAIVTSETTEPEVERLVPFQYYHVNKTYSDQMKMRHLFAVKNSGTLDGKHFKMYVSRNGEAATDVTSSNALVVCPNADGHVDTVKVDLNKLSGKYSENDELVFTCKAIDCSSNVSDVYKNTITMNVIGTTPTLALICSGTNKSAGTRKTSELTVGGDFLTGYNVADLRQQTGNQTFDPNTEWGFYEALQDSFIVTPVNGYAQFNKLNYEPFDILLLTDYPKSSKSEAAQRIIDDMAELCDYRPLLSFKTHFQSDKWKDKTTGEYKYTKWVKKGFTTAPVVPKQTATYVNIVCYAHPMFKGIDNTDDEYTFHDDDDPNQLVYQVLTGPGYEGDKGIQGFELADADNFVTIGLVHYNAQANKVTHDDHTHISWSAEANDRLLVAMAERQTNIEARMMLFSLNCGAQSLQTEGGRRVILQCLKYLLETDPLEVADCRMTFDNGAGNDDFDPSNYEGTGTRGDSLWSTAANWGPDYLVVPGRNNDVRIAAPCIVDGVKTKDSVGNEVQETIQYYPEVLSIHITENGSLTIPANSSLTARSTILRADENGNVYPTNVADISLGSNAGGNASLILNNERGDTKAGVAMYSKAEADMETMSAATSTWQYIGTPHTDVQNAIYNYYDSWLYQYDTNTQDWVVIPNGGPLVPFRGYCITHPERGHTYWMEGTLVSTTNQDITIPANKFVVVANSWTAPIQINELTDDDMEGLTDKTIYFFNTGSDPEGDNDTIANATGDERWAAGTYIPVPIHAADYTDKDANIPSMQGFYVVGGSADGTLHLDYERHVRAKRENVPSGPMHAPARIADTDNEPQVAKFLFRGTRYDDRLIILERPDFTRGYDSGWDGEQWGGNAAAPMSYVVTETRWDAVSAIPEYEGTVIAFRAGEDSEYTIHFDYDGMEDALYLLDTDTQIYTRVLKGNSYTFTCTDKAEHNRFILTRKAPQIATGVGNVSGDEVQGTKAKKLLIEDKMFIMVNGVLYDATGKVVK